MKLKIFGQIVPVKDRKNLIQDMGWAGFYDVNEKVIYLDPLLRPEERLHTLLHEFGHAVMYRISMNQTKIPHEVFEIMVDTFATAMLENFSVKAKTK